LAAELAELLRLRFDRIDFLDESAGLDFACPLDVPCTYSRDQALVALDFLNPGNRAGRREILPEKHLDVFFVTLNKSDKEYSPLPCTTITPSADTLFHWPEPVHHQ
jgi:hypothetical protein